MFNTLIIVYLFLGGCGSGLVFVMSSVSLVFFHSSERTGEESNTMRSLQSVTYLIALVMLVLAVLCLVADMGRPDRILLLFTRPTTSLLSIGTFFLTAMLLLTAFFVATTTFRGFRLSGGARKIGEIISLPLAIATMTYTGLFLQNVQAVAFWSSIALPLVFVVSSLSMGISIVFLVLPYVGRFSRGHRRTRLLHLAHLALLIIEVLILAAYLCGMYLDPYTTLSVQALFEGDLALWFIMGVLAFGLVAPLVSETYAFVTRRMYRFPLSDALCLVGGFCLRYCIVSAGFH